MNDFIASLALEYGFKKRPYFGVIYGAVGTGKSWLAANAESPLFVPVENGAFSVPGVARFNVLPSTFDEVVMMLSKALSMVKSGHVLQSTGQPIKTVVVDTISFIEPMIFAKVICDNPTIKRNKVDVAVKSIADYDYDQGYRMAMAYWERLLTGVDLIRAAGANVIFIAHSCYRNINDEHGTRKFIDLNLTVYGSSNPCERIKQDADWMYYVESEVAVNKLTSNSKDTRKIAANINPSRFVNTRATMLYAAKIRTENPDLIPNTYILDESGETAKKIFSDLNQFAGEQ